jgi:hypothetical protein
MRPPARSSRGEQDGQRRGHRYAPSNINQNEQCLRVTYLFTAGPANTKNHSVTDFRKLGPNNQDVYLFNSGAISPGGSSYTYLFQGAAYFTYGPTAPGAVGVYTGGVEFPVIVSPSSGTILTQFDVQWGHRLASWLVFDVKYSFQKAGRTQWSTWQRWLTAQAGSHSTFSPSAVAPRNGAGTYRFQAVLRNPTTGRLSDPSADLLISHVTVT